ncbi:MAG: hypothetical protein ACK4QL_04550 [Pseudanabaenaceae cyanobacterium]
MVKKIVGGAILGAICGWNMPVGAQRLDIPRLLTAVVPHNMNQERCLISATNALQTAGFSELTSTGSANDRSIYGKADGTNALFRCSQTNRVIIFALSTVNVTVDTRMVGEAVMGLFAQAAGINIPR